MKLNLGGGKEKKEGYKNVDLIDSADIQCDITKGLPIDDNSVTAIYSEDFFEHIPQDKAVFVMNEIYRVLKSGGMVEIICPNAGSINDFASPTHLSHWNTRTFEYFECGNRRYETDKEFSNIEGCFEVIQNNEVNIQDGVAQGIHIIMKKYDKRNSI